MPLLFEDRAELQISLLREKRKVMDKGIIMWAVFLAVIAAGTLDKPQDKERNRGKRNRDGCNRITHR